MQFDSTLLSTILCMVLIFALLSLLVSTITEALNSYFQERAQLLFRTIGKLFDDGLNVNFGQLLYSHPMVENLKKDINSLPHYISDTTFSTALIDVVANYGRQYWFNKDLNMMEPMPAMETNSVGKAGANFVSTFERFTQGVSKMQHTPLKLLLMNMIDKCLAKTDKNPLEELQKELQLWYNNQMERVSGWYKTWIRTRLFWISLLLALVLNIDSIHLFQTLYRSPDLRARLEPIAVQLAQNYAALQADTTLSATERAMRATMATEFKKDSNLYRNDTVMQKFRQLIAHLDRIDSTRNLRDTMAAKNRLSAGEQLDNLMSLGIPIGWRRNTAPASWFEKVPPNAIPGYFTNHLQWSWLNFFLYVGGIFITAFSLSAGAPFWFDLLLKLVNVRRSGTKPAESKS